MNMNKVALKELLLEKIEDEEYVASIWRGIPNNVADTQQLGMALVTAINDTRKLTGKKEMIELTELDFEFQYLLAVHKLGSHSVILNAHHQSEKVEGSIEVSFMKNGHVIRVSETPEEIRASMAEIAVDPNASADERLAAQAVELGKDQVENLSQALAATQAKLNDLQMLHDDVMNRLTGRDLTIVVHGGSDEHNSIITNYIVKNIVDQMFIEEDGVRRLKPEIFDTEDVTTGEDLRYVIGELILVHPHLKTIQLRELYTAVVQAISNMNVLQSAASDLGIRLMDESGAPSGEPQAERLGRLCADVMSVTAFVLAEGLEVALIDNRDINREEVNDAN